MNYLCEVKLDTNHWQGFDYLLFFHTISVKIGEFSLKMFCISQTSLKRRFYNKALQLKNTSVSFYLPLCFGGFLLGFRIIED